MEKTKQTKVFKTIIFICFFLYLLLLIKLTIFRYSPQLMLDIFQNRNMASKLNTANFVPFHSIYRYLVAYLSHHINTNIVVVNILGNIGALVPFGLALPVLSPRCKKLLPVLLWALALILSIELTQLFTGFGEFDVDDILLNTLGTLIGFCFYRLLSLFYHKLMK